MEPKEIVTSEGHKFLLKNDLTRAELKAVKRVAKSKIPVNLQTGEPTSPSMADIEDASREVLASILIVKIINPDGTEVPKSEYINSLINLLEEDEQTLITEANQLMSSQQLSKKKEIST